MNACGRQRVVRHDPPPTDLTLLACATGLTPCDASYLWLAGGLGADLVTADRQIASVRGAADSPYERPGEGRVTEYPLSNTAGPPPQPRGRGPTELRPGVAAGARQAFMDAEERRDNLADQSNDLREWAATPAATGLGGEPGRA